MKKVYFLVILIFISFPNRSEAKPYIFSTADSLNTSDSTIAEYYKTRGDSLFNDKQYDSARIYFDNAAIIYERLESWENYIDCLVQTGRCSNYLREFDKAVEIYKNTKIQAESKLNQSDIIIVRIINLLSGTYWRFGDYEAALRSISEAVMLAEDYQKVKDIETIEIISDTYNANAIINYEIGKYNDAVIYYQKAIDAVADYGDKFARRAGLFYTNLAVLFSQLGYFDEAMTNYKNAQEYYNIGLSENNEYVGLLYINIAVTMSESIGDYDGAMIYQDKAIDLFRELYGDEHEFTALAYYNKGDFLFKKGNPDEALDYFDKALKSYTAALMTEEHTDVAMTYNSMGEVYESLSDYDKAYEYYEKALSLRLKIFGEQHLNVAKGYSNLGTIKRIQEKYNEAIKYHEDALAILHNIFGEWHPEIAESYNRLGLVYNNTGQYNVSLQQFQNALMANAPSFSNPNIKTNPELDEVLSETRLLESLVYKAETLTLRFEEENSDITLLNTSYDTYKILADLIDRMRSGHKAEGSKLFLAQKASGIFERAISNSIQLHDLTGNNRYKNEAYFFCERSKARILQEAMNDSRAKNFSGIPDSLLDKEKKLKTDFTFYENQLQEEKFKREDIDSVKIREFESKLFSLNRDYQQLVENLEQNYPKYYSSKYFDKPIKIEDVQKSLKNNEALLEYFVGNEAVYLFCFTKDDYKLFTLNIDSGFKDGIDAFYSSINLIDKKGYLSSANQLYSLLIKPVENLIADKQKLTIIPDGKLYYVPFDALITEVDSQNTKDFSRQNYLVNRYDIAYHYSASFLIDSKNNFIDKFNNNGLIGFAPVFNNSPKVEQYVAANVRSVYLSDPEENQYRFVNSNDEILPLPYSEEELRYILNLFNESNIPADGYLFDFATKENFKSEAGKYKYIHLATHSFVNPEKPQYSGIILSQSEDTLSSGGTLYSNEIYNLDLNADLVVLSSCESGIGKLVKGEGMMALTRGFLYAGADNIITSLWKVYDKSTAMLMKSFYRYVLNNRTYSEALRQAKLEMIRSKRTSFPVNWSGFVLIGR